MEERQLIQRAKGGDREAFNTLLAMHQRRMFAITMRMFNKHQQDAEDSLQEAMLRIYNSIGGFKEESSFSTWVYRITMNVCLDELRRRKRDHTISIETLAEGGVLIPDDREGPEMIAVRRQALRAIERAIAELPEEMRVPLVLRDIHGYSYEEISNMLGINIGTVKSRISRARKRLRETIQKNPDLYNKSDD